MSKRFMVVGWLLSAVILAFAAVDDGNKPPKPEPITISAAEQKPIVEAYQRVVDANKDLQIAILKARIACKVDETWNLNFQTMRFEVPAPPVQVPGINPGTKIEEKKP